MSDQNNGVQVRNLLGDLGPAATETVKAIARGIGSVAGPLCVPPATETGLFLQDIVRDLRNKHAAAVLEKTGLMLQARDAGEVKVDPKIAFKILDEAAWADDDLLQSMWAGLLASACSTDGDNQGAIVFVNILRQLTKEQVKLIDDMCSIAYVKEVARGLVFCDDVVCDMDFLMTIWGESDLQRIDRELDCLRTLGLIDSGIIVPSGPLRILNGRATTLPDQPLEIETLTADITPTSLCLQLYARCKGHHGDVYDYFSNRAM